MIRGWGIAGILGGWLLKQAVTRYAERRFDDGFEAGFQFCEEQRDRDLDSVYEELNKARNGRLN